VRRLLAENYGNHRALTDMFVRLCRLRTALDLPLYPLCGTLLGLARGGALIPFDDDIDLLWLLSEDECNLEAAEFERRVIEPVRQHPLYRESRLSLQLHPNVEDAYLRKRYCFRDTQTEMFADLYIAYPGMAERSDWLSGSMERRFYPLASELFSLSSSSTPLSFKHIAWLTERDQPRWIPGFQAYLARVYGPRWQSEVVIYNHTFNSFWSEQHDPRRLVMDWASFSRLYADFLAKQ
jgi:hypothetical protein